MTTENVTNAALKASLMFGTVLAGIVILSFLTLV